ncbi:MAG: sigma-70 family RNA polymerase sigma factor [Planctomycetes bacterium]|nr:sigma-70 family RNA polymerase sigma factor [Planctomycetota bacterium]
MSEKAIDLRNLLERAAGADPSALGELFGLHRDRLRRMIQLRLDHRLRGRLDPSDVLQEAFLEFAQSLPAYVNNQEAPFYLWLRCIAGRKLQALHRQHLGTRMRDAGREVSLYRGALPEASSVALAAQLLGKLTTPSQACLRAELQLRVQEALAEMEPLDREVLSLRHYEQLSNRETAYVLGVTEATASIRFIRALRRLKELLARVPGLLGDNAEAEKSDP